MQRNKVTEILLNRMLKAIENTGQLPWRQPWRYRYAFNWYSGTVYKGVNRWLLPAGEYVTKNQINDYNKKNNRNFRFRKGIEWFPVMFLKDIENDVYPDDEIGIEAIHELQSGQKTFIKFNGMTYYKNKSGVLKKKYLCRRYYEVADIQWFEEPDGTRLKSKIETGEVIVQYEEPGNVVKSYTERESIRIKDANEASFEYARNIVRIPSMSSFRSEADYYSTMFHELGHSTGTPNRLNRDTIATSERRRNASGLEEMSLRSKEELIAEMCACLLCSETGIFDIQDVNISDNSVFQNSESYVKDWYNYLKTTKDDIVYIASDAEKASKFILGERINSEDECTDKMKEA